MTNKLFNFGNKTITNLFNGFFFLTLLFAVTSPNIILGDNKITGAGTTLFITWLLIIGVGILTCIPAYPRFRQWARQVFIVQKFRTALMLLLVVILWQFVFIFNVHPQIGFDVGAIHQALTNTTDTEIKAYFSLNYNNMPILLAQLFLSHLFSMRSWLFFDLWTVFFVDLSALLNILCVFVIDKKRIAAAMYLHALWLLIFPMIIVPYTDTWVLPFVSGYILCYSILIKKRLKWYWKLLAAIGLGITVIGAYFMKPSAIVGVIAIVLVEILYLLKQKHSFKEWISRFGLIFCVVFASAVTYYSVNQSIKQQTHIQVNTAREIPAIHFISMGAYGTGGYNAADALKMAEIPTKQGRINYSKKVWLARLKKKGLVGYIIFLFNKQRNNTADGSFAWVKEGHFINENPKPHGHGFSKQLREFVYLYGTKLGDFRFLAQFWWIIWLSLIAFGWHKQTKFVQILRLAVIGGFVYLLIFEGGRSRYLIQFLPMFLLLAVFCYQYLFRFFNRVYKWANKINKRTV